jgi:hypothetical protein
MKAAHLVYLTGLPPTPPELHPYFNHAGPPMPQIL